ncbi:hypothetical protein Vafri_8662 [Volvox africanus]|uniref:CSC1/OSCA1-like cytosolic domain-containing protein n=1 Tax=Volvox africanus TaxID=51714 RepID=A0A8J4B4B8_9CHLO|nr:hypothetical protein Vafri_8662 [Volvox africanus]
MKKTEPKVASTLNPSLAVEADTGAARRFLVQAAKQVAREEDAALKAGGKSENLHIGSSNEKIASYRGIGLGIYFKLLEWLFWMMMWMMLCSVPYLVTINRSVFTDYDHRLDYNYGVKVYDSFELASFTFAAIVDDKKDNGTLQYMNTEIGKSWKGPMRKGVFLTWIALVDMGSTVMLSCMVFVLSVRIRRWWVRRKRETREVADYAVTVGGLPPYVTASEVSAYFERRFSRNAEKDQVMEVQLVLNYNKVFKACKVVHCNELYMSRLAELGYSTNGAAPPQAMVSIQAAAATATASAATAATAAAATATAAAATAAAATATAATAAATAATAATAALTPSASVTLEMPPLKSVACPAGAEKSCSSTTGLRACLNQPPGKAPEVIIGEQEQLVRELIQENKLRCCAAIVTFNTEQMRAEVCKTMPSGWWASLFMRRDLRMSHGGRLWKLWVRRAAAPDDYRFENMSTRIRTNILIQVLMGLIMVVFIILCATLITWLSAVQNKQFRKMPWDMAELRAAIRAGMGSDSHVSVQRSAELDQTSYDAFCASSMASCMTYASQLHPSSGINMTYGAEWSFPNATVRLLNERPIRQDLTKCAEGVGCSASYCMPCYCLGLSAVSTDHPTPEFLAHIEVACSRYWNVLDPRRYGILVAISLVIQVINSLLTHLLRLFKFHVEKHWTITSTELSYAIWSYLVQLVNTVVVLLVVNCSSLRNLQKRALEHEAPWLQQLVLDGLFNDFTPEWYASIGVSIIILMMVNVAGPILRSLGNWISQLIWRTWLLYGHYCHCCSSNKLPTLEVYKEAFGKCKFTLEERISDVLFNLTLALLFGSGMPFCYLIAAVYVLVAIWWDRLNLLAWRQPAQRYHTNLPIAIMYLLPVLLMCHCAFGLWMHTYFRAELSSKGIIAAARQGISSLSHSSLSRRITQPNGLPLLIWFLVLGAWLIFGRWVSLCMYRVARRLGWSCTCWPVEEALRSTERQDVSYEMVLRTDSSTAQLRGPRTYRISHLTNYKAFLSTGAAARLWSLVQGDRRFTRLVSRGVYQEVA